MPSLMIHGEDKDLATVSPDQMRSWVESCYAMFPLWQKNKYQVIYAGKSWMCLRHRGRESTFRGL